jgi:Chaperone of endosialidase
MRDRNQQSISGYNSQPARLPAINVPSGIDPQLRHALEAIKERLEVREGARGNPFERVATLRDLEKLRTTPGTSQPNSSPADSGTSGMSQGEVDRIVARAVSAESAKLRSDVLRVEGQLRSTMTSMFGRFNPNDGMSALEAMAYSAAMKYTQAQLATDLANGAAKVIAGATSGSAVMELGADGAYVLFKHRDANINGLGAGYSGTVRTGLGITAAGLIAGFNIPATGAWQNSIVIDSSTGDVTILGTLKAGSVIQTGATIGVGGTSMGQLLTDVSSAVSTANAAETDALNAYNLAASKLDEYSSYTLLGAVNVANTGGVKAGSVTWNSTTGVVTGGSGVVFTENGITGVSSGVVTFSITALGAATFKGDIITSGDAQFSGGNPSTRTVSVGGASYSVDYSTWSDATTSASSGSVVRAGLIGYASASVSAWDVGVIGRAPSTVKGVGVVGDGGSSGGHFSTTNAVGTALIALNSAGGKGLDVTGSATFSSSITASGNVTAYSDIRLKDSLEAIPSPLDKVRALTGYTYRRTDSGERQTGLVAQDVFKVLPEAVAQNEDGYLSVAYGNLVGLLVEAIKELDRRTA